MCHTQGKGTWSSRLSETAPALPSRIFRARVSQADCGQGQLAIWFSPFTAALLFTPQWAMDYSFSQRPWLLETLPSTPHPFFKGDDSIQTSWAGHLLSHVNRKKNPGKDFNSAFLVTSSQPRVDLVLAVPYFAFRPLGKVSEQTPVQQDVSPPEPHEGSSRKHAKLLTS